MSASLQGGCDGQIRQRIKLLGDINTLASAWTNAAARSRIVTLLAEEETKFTYH
jgi:hypothetical protein